MFPLNCVAASFHEGMLLGAAPAWLKQPPAGGTPSTHAGAAKPSPEQLQPVGSSSPPWTGAADNFCLLWAPCGAGAAQCRR